jgi:hypothetical protein
MLGPLEDEIPPQVGKADEIIVERGRRELGLPQ